MTYEDFQPLKTKQRIISKFFSIAEERKISIDKLIEMAIDLKFLNPLYQEEVFDEDLDQNNPQISIGNMDCSFSRAFKLCFHDIYMIELNNFFIKKYPTEFIRLAGYFFHIENLYRCLLYLESENHDGVL